MLMKTVLFLFLCGPSLAWATTLTVSPSWDIDPSWAHDDGSSWVNLDIDELGPEPVAPRRLAIAFISDNGTKKEEILQIWDNPADRSVNISANFSGPRPRITLQPVVYEGQPWQANHNYSIGDKLSVGNFPSVNYWWECTRTGTSGTNQPQWPSPVRLVGSSSVVDNGSGTVNIPATAHGLAAGDVLDITGTINYDGNFTLPAQTFGDNNTIEVAAVYVPEVIGDLAYAKKRVHDSDGAGCEWQLTTGAPLRTMSGEPSGRIIIKDSGNGQAIQTGTTFILRSR